MAPGNPLALQVLGEARGARRGLPARQRVPAIGVNIEVSTRELPVGGKKQTLASSSNGKGLKWLPKLDSNQRPAD